MQEPRIERIDACPACGSSKSRFVCLARERLFHLSELDFEYSRCRNCSVVYQSKRPVESDIAAFYPSDYGPYQGQAAVRSDSSSAPQGPHLGFASRIKNRVKRTSLGGLGRLNSFIARQIPDPLPMALNEVYTPPRPGALLLDFGCGSTQFLDQAKARGWRTLGVDFVPDVVEAVRAGGHDAMLLEPGMWERIADGSISCVRMNHVIEHLYSPNETMTLLQRKLEPGGRIHLATPNVECLTFSIFGRRWFSLDCPRHIALYSPRSIRPLLERSGFEEIQTFCEVLTKDMARSIGYFLQDWGRLDDRGVLDMPNRSGLNGLLFAPARIAAKAGRSDRFHAFAKKAAG